MLYTSNGSFIDVAKIQAGEVYSNYMLGSRHGNASTAIVMTRYCPLPMMLCQYWPFQTVAAKPQNPLAPMLKALVTAAEAALETSIHSVLIAAHYVHDFDGGRAYAQAAADEMGLGRWSGRITRPADSLVPALEIEGECNDPHRESYDNARDVRVDDQLFLTVEYTRKSLTAALVEQNCGYQTLSRVRSSHFGHDTTEGCRSAAKANSSGNNFMSTTLRQMFKESSKQRLDAVIVLGEKADDGNLTAVLRQVLAQTFTNSASVPLSNEQAFSPDLAFAVSRAAAMFELRQKGWNGEVGELDSAHHEEP